VTDDQRAEILQRALGDDVVQKMNALRAALREFVWWPWSARRQAALFTALEDVMACQVNRVTASSGTVVASAFGLLEQRITELESRGGDDVG
jgi:hypothetical protein